MEEDSGRDKMTSELTTKDSELLLVMKERTFSTPEDVDQRNRDAIVQIGNFHGHVSGEAYEKIMQVVREDSNDFGRDKMTSELTTKDSELLRVMEERTYSTPEDVDQRNRNAIEWARLLQDDQINKLF